MHETTDAFKEGAAAAVANGGENPWDNPYLKILSEAHRRGEAIIELVSKANAWEEGWRRERINRIPHPADF